MTVCKDTTDDIVLTKLQKNAYLTSQMILVDNIKLCRLVHTCPIKIPNLGIVIWLTSNLCGAILYAGAINFSNVYANKDPTSTSYMVTSYREHMINITDFS